MVLSMWVFGVPRTATAILFIAVHHARRRKLVLAVVYQVSLRSKLHSKYCHAPLQCATTAPHILCGAFL